MPVRTPAYLGGDYDPGTHGQPGPRTIRLIESLPVSVKRWISRNTVKYLRPTKRRYALLIEDMGDAGTVHDLVDPPGPDAIRAAMGALAGLHAAFWQAPELDQDDETFVHMVTPTPTLLSDVKRPLPSMSPSSGTPGTWRENDSRMRPDASPTMSS